MLKILIPVDGSACALRAVEYVLSLAASNAVIECELLNVQEPMTGKVHAYRSREEIEQLEIAEAERVLRPVREILDAAGIAHAATWLVGEAALAIVEHAEKTRSDGIVMGMRGMGIVFGSVTMGSVTSKVIHTARIPLTIVK